MSTPWLMNDFEALWGTVNHSVICVTCQAARYHRDHDGWGLLKIFVALSNFTDAAIDVAWERVTEKGQADMDAIILLELLRHHTPRIRRLVFSMVKPLKESGLPYS